MGEPAKTPEVSNKTELPEDRRTAYKEVCNNHRAVSDFRGKLLALLPAISGAGIFVLLPKNGTPEAVNPIYLFGIGIFGFLVSCGLFLHELRGIEECTDLIEIGRRLEVKLGLREEGQFLLEYAYYHPESESSLSFRKYWNQFKGPVGAAYIIYPSVILAWSIVAGVGFRQIGQAHSPTADPSAVVQQINTKEELFRLELDRQQGKINQEEYAKAKSAMDEIMKRALARKATSN
jgi:hypothetical protein